MENNFEMIQELLRTKAEYQARLNLIPYDGVVEIKKYQIKNIFILGKGKRVERHQHMWAHIPKNFIKSC